MDSTDVDFYRAHGYLVIPDVIPTELLLAMRTAVDELVEGARGLTDSTDRFDLEAAHTLDQPLVRRINNPVTAHPVFDELMRSDLLLDLIEPLIGPDIRFQGNKLNMKTVGGDSAVEWHQDFAYYPSSNSDLLAIGIALDDSTLENGCLMVVPGSHYGPVLDHHENGVFVGAIDPTQSPIDVNTAVALECRAGGLSIHHVKLLHGSAPNYSTSARRLLLLQYAAVDAWPLLPVGNLDDFDAAIVRGRATKQFRVSADEIRIPLPEPAAASSIFEIQESATNRATWRRAAD